MSKIRSGNTNTMIFFLSVSNIVGNVLMIISGLLVAKWLLPEQLGFFNSFNIISSYIILAQLGIPMALGRNLPLFLGREEVDKANAQAAISHYWAIMLSVVVLVISAFGTLYFLFTAEYEHAVGAFTIGIVSFEGFYVKQYLKVLYRGNRDFNRLSLINILSALVACGAIVFVYLFGFYGMCIRAILIVFIQLSLSYYWRPTRVKPKWDAYEFAQIFKIGFPIFLVSNIYSLWPVLQRTLILLLGGARYLGLYAIVSMVLQSLEAITGAVNSVVYPSMSDSWGKGANVLTLFRMSAKPILGVASLFLLIIPIAWLALPNFVEMFLPNYRDGVLAAQWMLLTGLISIFNVWTNIYNVVGNQRAKLFAFICGVTASICYLFISYTSYGMRLEFFPQALGVGYLVILMANLGYVNVNSRKTIYQSLN